jgi:hypothetical protein
MIGAVRYHGSPAGAGASIGSETPMSDMHFCTCTDLECPLNPNAPDCRHRTCDRCIRKCLKAGEIPSCFFKAVHEDTAGNDDWTYQGFADWLAAHQARAAG